MKHLKNGFAAVIAILAVGLTLAVQAGTFESKSKFAADDCFRASAAITTKALCTQTATAVPTNCTQAQAREGQHLFGLNQVDPIPNENIGDACVGGTVFCCLTLEPDPAPCASPNPVQPSFLLAGTSTADQYRVLEVFCQP